MILICNKKHAMLKAIKSVRYMVFRMFELPKMSRADQIQKLGRNLKDLKWYTELCIISSTVPVKDKLLHILEVKIPRIKN